MFQCIDKSRDILDTELTAMAGESYDRAYGVSVYILFKNISGIPSGYQTLKDQDQ